MLRSSFCVSAILLSFACNSSRDGDSGTTFSLSTSAGIDTGMGEVGETGDATSSGDTVGDEKASVEGGDNSGAASHSSSQGEAGEAEAETKGDSASDDSNDDDEGSGVRFDVVPDSESGDETGDCAEKETECDGIDDDCNGVIDDVDVEGDGICDCLNVLILGNKGARPGSQFEEWLHDNGSLATRETLEDALVVNASLLESYHVLVVDWLPRDLTADEIDAVFAWVDTDGRGMITMTGYAGSGVARDRTRALTTPYGVTYRQVGILTEAATMDAALEINEGVTSVTFAGGYPVDTTGDGMTLGSLPTSGEPAGVAQEQGEGRLIVWGDEWISFDSEWSSMPEIPRMWANWLKWVQPKDFCDVPPPVE